MIYQKKSSQDFVWGNRMIFDTHAHLYDSKFGKEGEEVIKECFDNGVDMIMIPGDNIENSKKAIELANAFNNVYCSVGIHPSEVMENDIFVSRETLIDLAKNNKVKAIGEIGLDKYWVKDEKVIEKQKEFFVMQIEVANLLHLPIIVHDREAHMETYEIIKKHKPLYGGVIHCFSGSVEMMKLFVDLGFYIGIDGPVTYKNSIVPKEVCKEVPIERLVIETDSPYLPPVPMRGQVNYPFYLKYVIKKIAEIKNMKEDEIESITFHNGKDLFGII